MSARSTRRFLLTLLGVGVLAGMATRIAAAEDLLVVLDYDMGPRLVGCPSVLDFQRIVRQQVGYDPFRENVGRRVIVRADATEHGLEGRVDWQSANGNWEGERKFSSHRRDCGELAQAMSFAIAVQIQLLATTLPRVATVAATSRAPLVPDSVLGQAPRPARAPETANGVTVVKQLVQTRAPSQLPARRRSFAVGLGPSAGFGLAPGPGLEARVFGMLQLGHASVELGGAAAWPSTLRLTDGSGFSQYRLALTVAGCGHLDRWSACVLGDIGQTRVRGMGIDVPRSPSGTTALAGLRLAMTQRLGERTYVLAHADMLGLLTPWTITLNQTDVWTMPRFKAVVGIDLAFRFR